MLKNVRSCWSMLRKDEIPLEDTEKGWKDAGLAGGVSRYRSYREERLREADTLRGKCGSVEGGRKKINEEENKLRKKKGVKEKDE